MNILTKVSIVVLAVLILLACPVFITQAMLTPAYKDALATQQQKNAINEQAVREGMLRLQQVTEEKNQLSARVNRDAEAMQTELDGLKARLAGEQQRSAKLENDLSGIKLEMSKLRADYENNSKRTTDLSEQRDAAYKKIEALSDENRRLGDSLKQSQLDIDRQNEIVRTLREQLEGRDERIRQLEQRVGGAPGTVAAEPAPVTSDVRINGTVTAVNGDLASINVGSAKGVKSGMPLIIYRGSEYVAKLRVDQVDVGQSAGVIIDKRMDVAQGDKVTDRLE